jgi:hypothetical protein
MDDWAFAGCLDLPSISIPASLESIGSFGFHGCISLSAVLFETPSKLTNLGANMFSGCARLSAICVPGSVESIGKRCFGVGRGPHRSCRSLRSVTFESPSKLREIQMSAFAGCDALKSIALPGSLQLIRKDCFRDCSALELVSFESPPTHLQIEHDAFAGCRTLKQFSVPRSVKQLPFACFRGCASLSRLVFEPDSELTGIEGFVFAGCPSLRTLFIPKSIEVLSREWARKSAICELVFESGKSLEIESVKGRVRSSSGFRISASDPDTNESL